MPDGSDAETFRSGATVYVDGVPVLRANSVWLSHEFGILVHWARRGVSTMAEREAEGLEPRKAELNRTQNPEGLRPRAEPTR